MTLEFDLGLKRVSAELVRDNGKTVRVRLANGTELIRHKEKHRVSETIGLKVPLYEVHSQTLEEAAQSGTSP